MGTWTRINITGPTEDLERVKLDKLTRKWDEYIEESVDFINASPEPVITLGLGSKWGAEGITTWAIKFSGKYPTLSVNVREEWNTSDADEPGFTDNVYRAGEWIIPESKENGEVPVNLGNLLEMARFALTVSDPVPAREALTALIKGLE